MKISCILNDNEIREGYTDIIIYPEGTARHIRPDQCLPKIETIQSTSENYYNSIVAGAYTKCPSNLIEGVIYHQGKEKFKYTKLESEPRIEPPNLTHEFKEKDLIIGLMVCIDFYYENYRNPSLDRIRTSHYKNKILIIPGDAAIDLFRNNILNDLQGIHVAFCNNVQTYKNGNRLKSFIMHKDGSFRIKQEETEPIFADLS
jgi:hypothetical protein